MKYIKLSIIILLVSVLAIPCFAEVPRLIEYTGRLEKPNASPYPGGIYDITFQMCTDDACTTSLWSETHTVEISASNKKVIDGGAGYESKFSVILGSINPLDSLAFDMDYYLCVSEATLGFSKVEQIVSTSYAMRSDFSNYAETVYDSETGQYDNLQNITINKAKDADTVDGFHASDTPIANTLLPLNNSGQFFDSVIPDDITINMAKDSGKLGGNLPSYYAVAAEVQNKITSSCPEGTSIRVVNEDGSVLCESDDVNDAVSDPSGSYPSMSVGYAYNAGSANSANYASSAGSASNAGNADTVDGKHASSFSPVNPNSVYACTVTWVNKDDALRHRDVMMLPAGWGCDKCEKIFTHPFNNNSAKIVSCWEIYQNWDHYERARWERD